MGGERVKLGSVTAGLDLSNLHPTRAFCDIRAHSDSQGPIADCLAWNIASSLAMPRLFPENNSLLTQDRILFSFDQLPNPTRGACAV